MYVFMLPVNLQLFSLGNRTWLRLLCVHPLRPLSLQLNVAPCNFTPSCGSSASFCPGSCLLILLCPLVITLAPTTFPRHHPVPRPYTPSLPPAQPLSPMICIQVLSLLLGASCYHHILVGILPVCPLPCRARRPHHLHSGKKLGKLPSGPPVTLKGRAPGPWVPSEP